MAFDPAWPDKAMFAAYLLVIGGTLGLAVEGLRFVATVDDHLPAGILENYPHWLSTALAGACLVLGLVCLRTQAAVFGYAGALAGGFSLAYAGLLPTLSLLAVALLVKSRMEGEETRNDGIKLHTSLWPDKAFAASLFMVVGGIVILLQGVLIGLDRYEPILLKAAPWLAALIDVAVGLFSLWAARRVYHLKTPWLGELTAALLAATFALYVLGAALGLAVFVFMLLARKEDEFRKYTDSPGKPATVGKAKRAGKGAA